MKDELKQQQHKGIGPGGWHCACCAPAPKDRTAHRRRARARVKQAFKKEIASNVHD